MKRLIAASALAVVAVMLLAGHVTAGAGTNVGPREGVSTDWPRNDRGQTYGSALYARSLEDEPDLILVGATNGKTGYANKADLEGPTPASPEEALAWQAANEGKPDIIPVYEVDGVTQIGVFVAGTK